ncbi:hypothetical protein GCM10027161_37830 [Microbispora hainanensis]
MSTGTSGLGLGLGDGLGLGLGLGDGLGLGLGLGLGDGLGDVPGTTTWQGTPLTAKSVGGGLLPVQEPLNPGCNVPPDATAPFHDSLPATTRLPDWVHRADQPCVSFCEPGKVKVSFQLVRASPVFLIVTPAVKPPEFVPHWVLV